MKFYALFLCITFFGTVACPLRNPPDGCTPRVYRCFADQPQVCSASQRWATMGDLPCRAVNQTCVVANGLARCQVAQ